MSDVTIVISKHEVVLDRLFAEDTWELAFGDNAWEGGYTDADVLHTLKEFSKKAFAWDSMYEDHITEEGEDDKEEWYELREKMDTYLGSAK
tara:strand:+ start:1035 stop:1307 length:273 start_codon:yes stop_codon:yes gene_type:complete